MMTTEEYNDKPTGSDDGRITQMTDLIPRDAALKIYTDWTLGPEEAIAKLHAIPAIDPAAIREDALREAILRLNADGRWNAIPAIEALIGEKK